LTYLSPRNIQPISIGERDVLLPGDRGNIKDEEICKDDWYLKWQCPQQKRFSVDNLFLFFLFLGFLQPSYVSFGM